MFDFAHHHAADPFPAQLAGNGQVLDAQRVVRDAERNHSYDVAEQLAEQSPCRDVGRGFSPPHGIAVSREES
jgi:hypothetical protein